MPRTLSDIIIEIEAADNTEDEFNAVKAALKEIDRIQKQVNRFDEGREKRGRQAASERHKERLENIKNEGRQENRRSIEAVQSSKRVQAAEKNLSSEVIANTRRKQSAERDASNQAIANIRRQQSDNRNASNERIQHSRTHATQMQINHKDRLADMKDLRDAQRITGQEASRQIQRQRLEEQRLSREQRERFSSLRRAQQGAKDGFASWLPTLQTIRYMVGIELIFALQNVGRRVYEVLRNFEQIRLGFGSFLGSQEVADISNSKNTRISRIAIYSI